MADRPELTDALRAATRALEGEIDGDLDPTWHPGEEAWTIEFKIALDAEASPWVPKTTHWWAVIDTRYPAGRLDVFPSKAGGTSATFPHQRRNTAGPKDRPWRDGELCLRTDISRLARAGFDLEPQDGAGRLLWNLRRVRCWLKLAARGKLLRKGDPFELPDFRAAPGPGLVVFETPARFETWQESSARAGFVGLRKLDYKLLATDFVDLHETLVVPAVDLGGYVDDAAEEAAAGVWVLFDELPVVEPWQAPGSWKELETQAEMQGINLLAELGPLFEKRFRRPKHSREPAARPFLLVGFPIPERYGEAPIQIHWVGFQLPKLAGMADFPNGFRPDPASRLRLDKRSLARMGSIPWVPTESWADRDLTGRGRLQELDGLRVALIGCGAIGSQVAELLVRGGLRSIALVDGELLEAGNLVRHTLGLDDVGKKKAVALAERLHRISPHVQAHAVPETLGKAKPEDRQTIQEADLIIDCTADDGALFDLEGLQFDSPKLFVSMSTGPYALRLCLFLCRESSFDRTLYVDSTRDWIEQDWAGVDSADFPRGGIGCWHPLMPATHLDISLLVAVAVKILIGRLQESDSRLVVVGLPDDKTESASLVSVLLDEVLGESSA